MSEDWQPVESVAKDESGNYMALSGGEWVPVTGAARSDDGKFMAYGLTFKKASPYTTPEFTMRQPLQDGPRLPVDQQQPQQGTSYRATDMSPLLRQGAAARANMVTGDPGVMDPRYPAWKRSQEQADQLGAVVDVASGILPLAGPALRGASRLAQPLTSRVSGLVDTIGGIPARTGSEALKGDLVGVLNKARGDAATEAAARQQEAGALNLKSGTSPESTALTDIAGAQANVRGKLQQKAGSYGDLAQKQLDALAPQFLSAEDVGKVIQERGAANLERAKATTVQTAIRDIKDPAFAKARARAAAGDTPSTNPASKPILDEAVADIEQQIADTPAEFAQGLQKRVGALMGGERAMTEGEQRAENLRASVQGRQPESTVLEPLTLHQLEFLRRWAKDPALREQTGFGALDATRMARTSQTIEKAMQAYEPAVGQYINAYRTGKQAEGAILGARGERATDTALQTDAATIFSQKPQQVASTYLDGTQASAEQLLKLVGGDKAEAASLVRSYLRGQVEGKTPAQVLQAISKNNGLLTVFPDAKPLLLSYAKAGSESERLTALATKEGGRLRATTNAAGDARESARTARETARTEATTAAEKAVDKTRAYANDITILDTTPAEKVASQAQSTTAKMLKDGVIDDARYRELNAKIANIEKQFGQTKRARNAIKVALLSGVAGYAGGSMVVKHYIP